MFPEGPNRSSRYHHSDSRQGPRTSQEPAGRSMTAPPSTSMANKDSPLRIRSRATRASTEAESAGTAGESFAATNARL